MAGKQRRYDITENYTESKRPQAQGYSISIDKAANYTRKGNFSGFKMNNKLIQNLKMEQ
jgi:hypothetical protein